MIPIDPRPFTLRELDWMSEGAVRERWSRTSSMMALVANVNRDPKRGRPFRPEDFDPFAEKTSGDDRCDKAALAELRQMLEGKRKQR